MKTINVVAAIIVEDNKFLIAQRGYGEYKGYYEFPGGKIEINETKKYGKSKFYLHWQINGAYDSKK